MINIFNTTLLIISIISFILWITYKINNKILKKYKNYYFIIDFFLDIFPTILIVFIIRSFIYEPFQIPSSSMMPTLLIGDLIIVNKMKYNIKNPINNNTIYNIGKPNYNDIIVFQYPNNTNINYIKRVIGLPKDKIIYNEKKKEIKIFKYCKNKKKYCKKNIVSYKNKKISNIIKEIKINKNNELNEYYLNLNKYKLNNKSQIFLLLEKTEYINNKKHKILTNYNINNNNLKKKKWIVPKNMYFVIGDYRDNSEDSRYWGFLDKNLIIGKAEYIWMSFDKQKNLLPIWFRFNRIGKIN